uniref:Prephenate dehydrogenase n=1 Tax=Paulinella longichromatophora TaxID=1708747 RepID=A0A2H4ZPX8_9EUKA|nr:prephenate dehydrogenase [Paulinella longichromatophora]
MVHNQKSLLGIVGLGLIGGSLSLDLQAVGHTVHGLVSREETAQRALERELATVVSTDPKILSDCELVILAHPLKQLLTPSKELIEALSPSCIVTDVGSVKLPVLEKWQEIHPRFVASHPMAGTNESGVEAGVRGLFVSRPWIATPTNSTDPIALECVRKIAESVGSHWLLSDAKGHDRAVALVSHMPLVISTVLIKAISEETDPLIGALARALASSGFADTSRVGGGEPHIATGMMQNNTKALTDSILTYRQSLEKLEHLMAKGDWVQLSSEFENTKRLRPEFL